MLIKTCSYHKRNGKNSFVIKFSLSTIMKIPLRVKVSGCMGNTHTVCYESTHFLVDLKNSA